MEGQARKRNTDCVYFLASPLTCKKGIECEYRHSESARLNPRDCWYWLNRTCLNPHCDFRHPPLEGLLETVPEQTQLPSALPTSKANVPCYFYFNTYCINGDQCTFLHDVLPAQKFPKAAPDTTSVQHHPENIPKAAPDTTSVQHHPENKPSARSDTGPASIEVPSNPPGDCEELIELESSKEVIQQPAQGIALEERSPSTESSVPGSEEPGIKLSEDMSLPTEFMNGSPQLHPDQGFAENANGCVEADEWLESSPGFDVLVDDESEQLPYDEDGDYIPAQERESEMIHSHALQYDYDVPSGYDPLGYPNAGFLFERGVYDSCDHMDSRCTPEYFHKASEQSSERRNLEPTSHRRTKLTRMRHEIMDDRDDVDLRDHLRKHRRMDVRPHMRHYSRNREDIRDRSPERPERHWMMPSFHGRLVTEWGNAIHDPALSESEFALSDSHGRSWSRPRQSSRHTRSRLREGEGRRRNMNPPLFLSSKNSQRSFRRADFCQTRHADAALPWHKPPARIKEYKRRAREVDCNSSAKHIPQGFRRHVPEDFEGPKPLKELLKDKRRFSSANDNSSGMVSGDDF